MIDSDILPHQRSIVDRIQKQHGLIAWHGLGSGKTRSSIEAIKALNPKSTTVILPAALESNYKKELDKWYPDNKNTNINFITQQDLSRQHDVNKVLKKNISKDLVIIDEAHRARTPGSNLFKNLKEISNNTDHILMLTGTPVYNDPKDLYSLFELSTKGNPGVTKTQFNNLLNYASDSWFLGPKSKKLIHLLKNNLDVYLPDKSTNPNFPKSTEETIAVPMSESQKTVIKGIYNTLPGKDRKELLNNLKTGDLSKMTLFLQGIRALANSSENFIDSSNGDPKITKAYEYLKQQVKNDPNYKAIVYSNFLKNGLDLYKAKLDKDKIKYEEYSGKVTKPIRDRIVKKYNEGKINALLLSSAGGEGLDLKNTNLVQILEPHFNDEKINQVIGRAIRYKSHESLPEDKRNVLVQRYLSTFDKPIHVGGNKNVEAVDTYLDRMSKDKLEKRDKVLKAYNRNI